MNTKLLTRSLKTGDITLNSNQTSITVNGVRISRVEEVPGQEQDNPATIYLDFKVQDPMQHPDVLEATEEVDLVLNLDDAVELGIMLVAMGLEHKNDTEVTTMMTRLSRLIAEYR